MTTTYSTDAARAYLDRVRDLLSDLPEEERAELIQDLASHVAEIGAEDVEAELGSPEDFVAEFRAMADLEQRHPRPRLADAVAGRVGALRNHPALVVLRRRWPDLRPVWVAIRGWLGVSAFAVLSGGTAFDAFPIPQLQGSAWLGVLAAGAATAASVMVDRRSPGGRPWRAADIGLNLILAWLLALTLFAGPLYTVRGAHDQAMAAEQWVRDDIDALLPQDLVATTPDGTRLEAVLLYDEAGHPFDLAGLRWQLGLDWPHDGVPGREPGEGEPSNVYPLSEMPDPPSDP